MRPHKVSCKGETGNQGRFYATGRLKITRFLLTTILGENAARTWGNEVALDLGGAPRGRKIKIEIACRVSRLSDPNQGIVM